MAVAPLHPGVPRTLMVSGFVFQDRALNGDYELDPTYTLKGPGPSWTRSDESGVEAYIAFNFIVRRWMLTSQRDPSMACHLSLPGQSSPVGDWEYGILVEAFHETPSPLAMLAFPRPEKDLEFYAGAGTMETDCKRPQALLARPDLVFLETVAGEQIPAIFKQTPSATATLLYSHGNAEDLSNMLELIDIIAGLCQVNILAYEYVGYSLSRLEGQSPSEEGCYRSIDAAWQYLTMDLRLRPCDIVLFGRSIGSGPTVDLASRLREGEDCAGVVLQGPIASAGRCALGSASNFLWLVQSMDMFVNVDKIGQVSRPVAIIHGTADEVVPIANGKELFKLVKMPFKPLWLNGCGHNNMPIRQYSAYIVRFLLHLRSLRHGTQVRRSHYV